MTGTLTVKAGSTLNLSTFTLASPTSTVLECGASSGSAISGTGQLTLGGNITVNDAAGAGTDGAVIGTPVALGANRTITVADDGSTATDLTISKVINGSFGITKADNGHLDLSAANTYSGSTTINAGTIRLAAAAQRIANTSKMVLNGGTFSTGASTGFSETVSTLKLTENSTINFGTGVHTLTFANSSAESWTSGKELTITGWTGTMRLPVVVMQENLWWALGGLTTTQLTQITFSGFSPGAVITGSGEVVPKAKLFYSNSSGAPETPGNWNTERDGTGTDAVAGDFSSAGTFFIVQGSGNGGTTPHTMTTSSAWSIPGVGAKIQIEDGATLVSPAAITIGTGGVFQMDNGSTYKHQNTGAWSTTVFQGSETLGSTSTLEINKTATTLPDNNTYGNLIINLTADPGSNISFDGNMTTINGSLTILNTQNREVQLGTTTSTSLTIANDLSVSGASSKLVLTGGSGSPDVSVNGMLPLVPVLWIFVLPGHREVVF